MTRALGVAAAAGLLLGCGADTGQGALDDGSPRAGAAQPADSPATPADTPAAPRADPADGAGAADPVASPGDATAGAEWTAGVVERAGRASGQATLNDVRIGRHEGYDRVTFELDALPDYHLEYVDRPVRQCGSGHVVEVAGDGWLRVRLHSARAHTEAGRPTIDWRERRPDLPVILEVERICDFEGEVAYVIGVRSPNRFRILTLDGPPRLVVDIRH